MRTFYQVVPMCCAMLATGCGGTYEQLQSVAVFSTRQVDLTRPNAELARGVEGFAKTGGTHTMEQAVNDALAKVPGGTVLVNMTVSENTKKNTLMVKADVWGIAPATVPSVATGAGTRAPLAVGTKVMFTPAGDRQAVPGEVIGLNAEGAMVRYGKDRIQQVPLDRLTLAQ